MPEMTRYSSNDFAQRKITARLCSGAILEARRKGFSNADIANILNCSEGHIMNCATGSPDKLLSLDCFITMLKECELGETIGELALSAGGYFIMKPEIHTNELDLFSIYSDVLKEEGEDSVKAASLFRSRHLSGDIDSLLHETDETIEKLLVFQEALKIIKNDKKKA